jgi:hypothetical protein
VLKPAVTTAVPAALLHTEPVRQLLINRLIDVVDGAAWDADIRQRRASRTDWARAIAAAEQAEFDRMRAGLVVGAPRSAAPRKPRKRPEERKRRDDEWPAERIAHLRQRWAEGATKEAIGAELGVTPSAALAKAMRLGLGSRRHHRMPWGHTRRVARS